MFPLAVVAHVGVGVLDRPEYVSRSATGLRNVTGRRQRRRLDAGGGLVAPEPLGWVERDGPSTTRVESPRCAVTEMSA